MKILLGVSKDFDRQRFVDEVLDHVERFGALVTGAVRTPLGTLVSYHWINSVEETLLVDPMAASAGALFYFGATHLLPMAEREPRRFSPVVLGAGVATALGITVSAH